MIDTAAILTPEAAEEEIDGRRYLRPTVKAGDLVTLDSGWVVTITQESLDCDCGKGVLCPYNPQTKE